MAKRTTRITVETHSLTVLRTQDSNTFDMWCAACGAETQMVTVELAARLCSATQRTIFRLVEAGSLHFNETPAGQLLICAESLRRLAKMSDRQPEGGAP
ncbi:MAG TPA: hypothetical protein VK363_14085 [Pyrinomonadaceae bacterium]|nr:hypothetical protein [Pyrinomonadaceae bacterium]